MSLARSVTVRLDANVSSYIAKMNSAGAATTAAMGKADKSVVGHSRGLAVLGKSAAVSGLAVAGGLGYAVKSAANFDQAMSKVEAATGKGGAGLKALREAAIQAGADTVFSASQAAGGIENLAKAGVSSKNILGGGLRGALDLAAAGELEVADAAEIAATALTQFKLRGQDIPHVADLLAAGAGKAQGEVSDLAAALNQAGLVAAGSGLSIEETTGTLAAFASAGLTGSDAGTSFKTMLQRLQAPIGAGKKEMDRLNISAYDAQGNFIGMERVAAQLRDRLSGLTSEQRDAALATMFGSDAVRAARVLYEQGGRGISKWTKAVDDQGFAARTAGTRLDNLKGDVEQLGGSFETAMIKLGSGAQSPLRDVVQDITSEINRLSENGTLDRWGKNAADAISGVIDVAKDLGPAVGSALQTVGSGVKAVADGFSSLPSGVQKALITGAVVAAGAKKLGVTSLVGAAANTVRGGGGLGGRGGVVPVFVTNMGAGLGGPAGKGGSKGSLAGRVAAGVGAAGGAAAVGTIGAAAAALAGFATIVSRIGGDLDRKLNAGRSIPQGSNGRPTQMGDYNRPTETQILNPFAKNEDGTIRSAKMYSTAGTMIATAFAGVKKAVGSVALDLSQFQFQAEKAGISSGQLAKMMNTLPPSVQTEILTPGALESKADVTALAKQFGLTPRQVRTMMELVGAKEAEGNTKRVREGMRRLNTTSAKPKVLPQGMEETTSRAKVTKRSLDALVRTFKSRLAADDGSSPKARAAKKAGLDFARAYKASLQAGDSASPKSRAARATAAAFAKTYLASLKAANATGPGVAAARAAVNSVNDRTVTITTRHVNITVQQMVRNPSLNKPRLFPGGDQANGGIYDGATQTFASGGYTEAGQYVPRVPQMRQGGGNVLWSEPETGWEAYISGKPGMRERNLLILEQAAARLGADVVRRYADGGVTAHSAGVRAAASNPSILITSLRVLRAAERELNQADRLRKRRRGETAAAYRAHARAVRGISTELTRSTEKLKTVREQRRDYATTVAGAYVQDPFSGTLGGFRSQVGYETRNIRGAAADLQTLAAKGLDGALYKGLAASGNVALIDQFSKLTREQIAGEERRYAALNRVDRAIGNQAANKIFNTGIRDLTVEVRKLTRRLDRLDGGGRIGNQITNVNRQIIREGDSKVGRKRAAQKVRNGR